jgi:arylsulfatase A-like enzyme
LTGLHPHETGIGWMTSEPDRERGEDAPPAYQGHLNEQCVTLAEALKSAGYGTYMTGKWHLGQKEMEDRPAPAGLRPLLRLPQRGDALFPAHRQPRDDERERP